MDVNPVSELIKAAVLNAVKMSVQATNVVVAKQWASRYPNMNKINNVLTSSVENVQQMTALLNGTQVDNPLTNLLNSLTANAKQLPAKTTVEPQIKIDYNLLAKAIVREERSLSSS